MTRSEAALDLPFPVTEDAFLDGAIRLIQPESGAHRSGSDAMFLASALLGATGRVLDMGAGAGVVGLLVAQHNPNCSVVLAENNPTLLACAGASVAMNAHVSDRVEVCNVDLLGPEASRIEAGLGRAAFDHVISNPPYRRAGHVRSVPEKADAHVISDDALDRWMRTAAAVLKPGGTLTLIFAADGLEKLLATMNKRFGAISIVGLHPAKGTPAERLIITAIKGRKTAPAILPGLILHESDGSYTAAAQAILKDGRALMELTG